MQVYLVNALIFCVIILVLVLAVAALQLVLVMIDVRRMTREVKEKFLAITSVLDIVTLLVSGLSGVKNKLGERGGLSSGTVVAFAAGLKKALKILFNKNKEEN